MSNRNKVIRRTEPAKKPSAFFTKDNIIKIIEYVACVISPIIIFYLFEWMLRNPFEKMYARIQFLNIIFFMLLFLFLFFITGKAKHALRIESVFCILIGLIDYFIIQFRSTPVMPWDLLSISTAASVANNYSYKLSSGVITILIIFLILLILFGRIKLQAPKKVSVRIACAVAVFLCLFGYTKYVQSPAAIKTFRLYDKLFTPTSMTYKDGTVVAFLMQLQYMDVEKPHGYSAKKAEEILLSYEDKTEASVKPNIIVIMNEAFSDLSVLDTYNTNMDEIPYMRSLMAGSENTISGYLDVSVLGGNTANTEFEFLTGSTMGFLPNGSVPYQQYVKSPTESLASHLKELGYATYAMHPYNAAGWDRDDVYQYFGFDTFYSKKHFKNPEIIRKYVSDQADINKIKEIFENKEPGVPMFMFNVTMQNHSSYTEEFDNFTPDIEVEGSTSYALNNYLSLLKKSDEALEDLISYFDSVEEPTIIVFFGDHQPTDSVVSPIYKLNNRSVYSLSDAELYDRYKVPYIIHANFDIEEESKLDMSVNFLAAKLLETADLPKTNYFNYLSELQKKYNSITALQYRDATGTTFEITDRKDSLLEYEMLQYYQTFD